MGSTYSVCNGWGTFRSFCFDHSTHHFDPETGGQLSGVNRGQREHKDSFRDIRKKSFAPAPPQQIRAIYPLKLPSLNTDLY